MPRKKTLTETEAHKPLISIERIIYEKTAFKLSKGVLVNLEQYVSYVKDATGDEPTPDEVVDKGIKKSKQRSGLFSTCLWWCLPGCPDGMTKRPPSRL